MVGIRSRGRSGEDSAALCTVVNPRPETPLVSGGFSMVLRAARHAAGAPSGALRHGQAVVSAHVGGGPVPDPGASLAPRMVQSTRTVRSAFNRRTGARTLTFRIGPAPAPYPAATECRRDDQI